MISEFFCFLYNFCYYLYVLFSHLLTLKYNAFVFTHCLINLPHLLFLYVVFYSVIVCNFFLNCLIVYKAFFLFNLNYLAEIYFLFYFVLFCLWVSKWLGMFAWIFIINFWFYCIWPESMALQFPFLKEFKIFLIAYYCIGVLQQFLGGCFVQHKVR